MSKTKATAALLTMLLPMISIAAFSSHLQKSQAVDFQLQLHSKQQSSTLGTDANLIVRGDVLVLWNKAALSIYKRDSTGIHYLQSYSAEEILGADLAEAGFSQMILTENANGLVTSNRGIFPQFFTLSANGELTATGSRLYLVDTQFTSDAQAAMGRKYNTTDYEIYKVNSDLSTTLHKTFAIPFAHPLYSADYAYENNLLFIPSASDGKPVTLISQVGDRPGGGKHTATIPMLNYYQPISYNTKNKVLFATGEDLSCYLIAEDGSSDLFDFCKNILQEHPELEYVDSSNNQLLLKRQNALLQFDLNPEQQSTHPTASVVDSLNGKAALDNDGVYWLSASGLNYAETLSDTPELQLIPNTESLHWNGETQSQLSLLTDNTYASSDGKRLFIYKLQDRLLAPLGSLSGQTFFDAAISDVNSPLQFTNTAQGQFVAVQLPYITLAEYQPEQQTFAKIDQLVLSAEDVIGADWSSNATIKFVNHHALVNGQQHLYLLSLEPDKIRISDKIPIMLENNQDWLNSSLFAEADNQLFHVNLTSQMLYRYAVANGKILRTEVADINITANAEALSLHGADNKLIIKQNNTADSYLVINSELRLLATNTLPEGKFKLFSPQLASVQSDIDGLFIFQFDHQTGELHNIKQLADERNIDNIQRHLDKLFLITADETARISRYSYNLPPYQTQAQIKWQLRPGVSSRLSLPALIKDDEQHVAPDYSIVSQHPAFTIESSELIYNGEPIPSGQLLLSAVDIAGLNTEIALNYDTNRAPEPINDQTVVWANSDTGMNYPLKLLFIDPDGDKFHFIPKTENNITLSTEGVLSGKPEANLVFQIDIADEQGAIATYPINIQINYPPQLRVADGIIQAQANQRIEVDLNNVIYDPENTRIHFFPMSLPDNLSVAGFSNEILTGRMKVAGDYSIVIRASDDYGASVDLNLILRVLPSATEPESKSGGSFGHTILLLIFFTVYRMTRLTKALSSKRISA